MGMATVAVEPTILRYQMAIVSITVGCSSLTNLRGGGRGERGRGSIYVQGVC